MNRIFKSIWSVIRHCFVVVSEAQKAQKKDTKSKVFAATLAAILSAPAIAQDYTLEVGQDYVFGDLTDVGIFNGYGQNSITINSINSPTGQFDIGVQHKPGAVVDPETGKYRVEDMYFANLTVNQDVTAGYFYISARGDFNGDITIIGNQTTDWYVEQVEEALANNTNPDFKIGQLVLGGNEIRPLIVKGNVKAPVFRSGSQVFYAGDPESQYWGYVHIMGNVDVDILSTDNFYMYDDMTDHLIVDGTVTVSRIFINNGSSDINKLIVKGTFYNGYGPYTGSGVDNPLELVGAEIDELDATNIVNGSNLYVGTLTNDEKQTYTQTFGTIQVSNNWFKDSIINMSGGIIDESSLGPDKNLGINNVFNVSGGTLKVSDLNFDSEVNLSGTGKIETALDSIFLNPEGDPEALNYVGLNSSETETTKQSLSKWFVNYVPGTLREDLEDHVNFNGGSIVISGFGTITETQYNDLMDAFKDALLISKQTRLNAYF